MNNPHASAIRPQPSAIGRAAASSVFGGFAAIALFLAFAATSFGQTTLFSDNFGTSRGATYSAAAGAIGSDTNWSMSRAGADWGARIHGDILDLSNDASGTANANGWVFGYRDINALAGWNTTLSSNTGTITWEFNMRQKRPDPAGFSSTSSYGTAFVLVGTSATPNTGGSGYAVVHGQSGSTDPVRLVSFNNGLQGTLSSDIIASNTVGLTDFGTQYLSIRVTYIPSSNTWELFVRNDDTAFTDPTGGSALTSQGTAVNSTYTSTAGMRYIGGYTQGSTGANETAFFDNVYLKKTDATAPTGVTTGSAGSITASGATISTSNVAADGGSAITERGVVYATTSNPTTSNTKVTASGTTGTFDSALTGLAAGTTYYVRAYATNSVGTTYGSDVSFTTSAGGGSPTLSAVTLASALSTTNGTASAPISFTASGSNLSGNITVTAQAGYEVSTSAGSGYGASVSVASGTTVYIRFAASQAIGTYNTATAAVLSSSGASNVNATTSASGNTVTAAPVVIFTEGLNESTTYVTASGGTYLGGNSSTGTWPQNVNLFSEGSHSYRVSNTTGNITSTAIDTTYGSSMSLSFRLAAFSGTGTNGMEAGDTVTLATSTDNGTTWSNEIQVAGNNNARWSFSGGTGNASATYDGNNSATSYSPASGGEKTTDGFSTVFLSGLPQAAQFRFRITAVNNAADERWHIDEIIFRGVLPTVSVNTTTLTAFTATAGTASAAQTFTVNGTNLVADIAVGPLTGFEFSTDGTTYSSSLSLARSGDAVANTTIHVRLAANAQLGTYNSQTISIASTGAIAKTVTTAASGNAMSANPADLTAFATAVTQNFNTLASTGTSSTMPTSWYFLEAGSSGEVDGVYAANTGSSSTGNTYSMGATSDSDRAIGSIRTSTFNSTYGVALRNTSGSTITTLVVSYTGETWRVGSASRSDTIDFAYSTDATTLASGSWTDVDALDYANPGQATGSGSLQHSSAIAHTITGLSIPNNATFFLRWSDADATGNDDMMGIDDVSITALGSPVTTLNAAESNATSADFTTTYATASANQSFTIGGSNLQGNITATAGTGFEVSSDGTTYGATATFTRNATYAASGTLYARLTASASAGGTYTSATVATLTSTNAATRTISTDSSGSSVAKATPTINSAPTASAITFGQTLASSGLSGGSATVAGSFVFTTPSTAPAAGTASQGVTFNPTDSTNYNSAATSVSVTVNQATPTVSVAPTASAITYGQALSSSTITPGTSSVPGAYAFVSPATTPNAGTASQSVTFTPTDTGNYTTASTSASVTVNQAALTITGLAIANKTYDGSDAATITGTAAYSGLVLGQSFGVTGTGSATFANSTVGSSKPVTVIGYTAPNGNYSITQPTGLTGNITAASVTVTAGNQTKAFGASDPALTYTPSPALIVGNSFTGALSRASGEGVGTYAISQGTLSAGSNYTITFVGANLTITQATASITTPPTASTITSGQALSDSILSGGAASVAGAFAFTTPGTVPSPGIDSQGVTFTPTDSGNYTAPTTSVDVGVLRAAPVLTRASNPTGTGFTVNWAASPGSGNYTVIHSASKSMSSATSVDTGSTSLALTVSTGIRYVQVRANNAAGASANSTMQANNLQSLPAGATRYLSVPGTVNGGNATLAEKFGSANEAGLAAGGTPSTSTNIILLNADGSSQTGVYFLSGNWVRGASIVNDEVVPAGKAFMLKNNSGSTDHILLGGTPTTGPRNPIALSASGGAYSLLTPARSQPTALNALGLTGGNATNSLHPSAGSQAADLVLIPQPDGTFRRYHYDGTKWKSGLRDVADPSTVTVPAGGAFFIRKASDSSFEEWTPPAEE